jgi:hypothetical protein
MIYGNLNSNFKLPSIYEKLRYNFVTLLRAAFASEITDENLRYSPDKTKRKIEIYPTYPQVLEFFPSIAVNLSSLNFSHTYLEDELQDINFSKGSYLYNGIFTVDINMTVYSKSIRERDRIVDHIILFFKHLFVNHFRELGIQFRKDMRVSDESVNPIAGGIVYSNTISIPCSIEYEIERISDIEGIIQQINIENLNIFWEEE